MKTEQQETSFDGSVAAAREAFKLKNAELYRKLADTIRKGGLVGNSDKWDIADNVWDEIVAPMLTQAAADKREIAKQRDFLVEEYERAVGCEPQGYLHCAMHLFNAITNAQIDARITERAKPAVPDGWKENGNAALAHISNVLDDLQYSPDQRPVPLLHEAMYHIKQMIAAPQGVEVES